MITVRQLLEIGRENQTSPDGVHWEPSIPLEFWSLRRRLHDAWEVFQGRAVALTQTPKGNS